MERDTVALYLVQDKCVFDVIARVTHNPQSRSALLGDCRIQQTQSLSWTCAAVGTPTDTTVIDAVELVECNRPDGLLPHGTLGDWL